MIIPKLFKVPNVSDTPLERFWANSEEMLFTINLAVANMYKICVTLNQLKPLSPFSGDFSSQKDSVKFLR